MKGRVIALGEIADRKCAALWIDGHVEDFLADPKERQEFGPGAILRATVDRPVKGMGGVFLKLPGANGYLRGAKGLSQGQAVTVQITGHPDIGKALPVTDRIIFKGRGAILTPGAPGLNISRSIKDEETRLRLHDAVQPLVRDNGLGLILRTQAAHLSDQEIADEVEDLVALTESVLSDKGTKPELLVAAPSAHDVAWREWSVPEPDAVEEGADAFTRLAIDEAILDAMAAKQTLGASSFVWIEPTRALVAVDVNTGAGFAPAAALDANLKAVEALPRHLRVRGLGGQITIDFAPLPKRDRPRIEAALKKAFRADPVETSLVGWTPLGHFELQRKRERAPVDTELQNALSGLPAAH